MRDTNNSGIAQLAYLQHLKANTYWQSKERQSDIASIYCIRYNIHRKDQICILLTEENCLIVFAWEYFFSFQCVSNICNSGLFILSENEKEEKK